MQMDGDYQLPDDDVQQNLLKWMIDGEVIAFMRPEDNELCFCHVGSIPPGVKRVSLNIVAEMSGWFCFEHRN